MNDPDRYDLYPWRETFSARYPLPTNPKDRRAIVRRERRWWSVFCSSLRAFSPRWDRQHF